MLLHDLGEVTKVGGGGDAGIAVIQTEADGLRRVMGDEEWRDPDVAQIEVGVAVEGDAHSRRNFADLPFHGLPRGPVGQHGDMVLSAHDAYACDMVAMLVRHEDGVQRSRVHADGLQRLPDALP